MRRLARVVLFFCVLFVSFLLGEGLVRILGLAPDLRRIRVSQVNSAFRNSDNPILGYELRENAVYSDQPHSENSRTNSHGQWDIERSYEKPAGTRRILVLGDSVVLGGDVFDLRNTMTGHLGRMLAESNIEVLNFGVTGYCTRAEVELLKQKGLRYDPDLVILVFVWNDYLPNGDINRTVESEQPKYAQWLFVKSTLFRLLGLQLNLFGFRDLLDRERAHSGAVGGDNVTEGLALLKELSLEHDFETFVAVWPHFGASGIVDRESRNLKLEDHREVAPDQPLAIEGLAQEAGLPLFRLSRIFSELSDVAPGRARKLYTVDGMHATEQGCRLAAEGLKLLLEQNPQFLKHKNPGS